MTDRTRADIAALTARVNAAVVGQEAVVHSLILALLCNGNVLLEGLPGTAKTRSIKTLGHAMGVNLGRIQFTPDLLPADVTGSETYHSHEKGSELIFEPGPIFNELVLADEINRAPAKVQSALLEAMEERQVTVAGKSYPLPPLFLVMATQNPIETLRQSEPLFVCCKLKRADINQNKPLLEPKLFLRQDKPFKQ